MENLRQKESSHCRNRSSDLMADWVGDRLVERDGKALKYLVKRRQLGNHQTTVSDV